MKRALYIEYWEEMSSFIVKMCVSVIFQNVTLGNSNPTPRASMCYKFIKLDRNTTMAQNVRTCRIEVLEVW